MQMAAVVKPASGEQSMPPERPGTACVFSIYISPGWLEHDLPQVHDRLAGLRQRLDAAGVLAGGEFDRTEVALYEILESPGVLDGHLQGRWVCGCCGGAPHIELSRTVSYA